MLVTTVILSIGFAVSLQRYHRPMLVRVMTRFEK